MLPNVCYWDIAKSIGTAEIEARIRPIASEFLMSAFAPIADASPPLKRNVIIQIVVERTAALTTAGSAA